MIRTLFVAALLLPFPAFAEDVFLTIDNQSSMMVDRVNTFPLNEAGEPVEDNIGGTGDILPGVKETLPLSLTACGQVLVSVGMAGETYDKQIKLNLCKSSVVVVTD